MSGYIGNTPIPQATQTRDSFTATASQTSFATGGYTPNFLDVYLNGLKLNSSQFTATNGTDVVLTSAASSGDIVEVIAYTAFEVADASFDDLALGGDLTVGGTVDGRDIAADGTKLDGIESGATGDQTNAEIRAAVEAATDSNVFTDADHTKLNAIEASATADQTASEIRTLVESATDSNVFTDADHTKLNAIESGATADQTKSDIDALNINADTLDGQHGSYYTGYADTAVANIVDSAPGTLDTLNELAAALGDDPNFATTVTNSIATKLPLAGGTLTGNLDVGGTVTADGLTVEANAPYINISNTGENVGGIKMYDSGGASTQYFNLTYDSGASNTVGFDTGASGEYTFSVNTSEKMRIDSSGNLLVGKTAIDNTTAGHRLDGSGFMSHVRDGNTVALYNRLTSDGTIVQFRKDGTTVGNIGTNGGDLTIGTGNVGLKFNDSANLISAWDMTANAPEDGVFDLGYSNGRFKDLYLSGNAYANSYRHDGDSDTYLNFPAANQLSLVGGGATIVKAYQIAGSYGVLEMHGSGSATYPNFTFNGDSNTGMYRATTDTLAFTTAGAERMRIDSSGNVLVGKTSASIGTVGCELRNDGYILGVNDGDAPLFLNRKSSDGDIAKFYKDGASVGSIGVTSSRLTIGGGDTGLRFVQDYDEVTPWNPSTNGVRDAAIDLGSSSNRFKDAHFSGTVSATSFTGSGANLTGIEGVPQGVIVMWSGQTTAIPTGWALCDGTNGTPNLIDKFIMGASASNETTTGGANSRTLSTANIPNHTHSFSGTTNTTGAHTHDVYIRRDQYLTGDGITGNDTNGTDEGIYLPKISGVTSSNGDHSHTISGTTGSTGSGSSFDNRPAYMALAYIMKT